MYPVMALCVATLPGEGIGSFWFTSRGSAWSYKMSRTCCSFHGRFARLLASRELPEPTEKKSTISSCAPTRLLPESTAEILCFAQAKSTIALPVAPEPAPGSLASMLKEVFVKERCGGRKVLSAAFLKGSSMCGTAGFIQALLALLL